MVTKGGFDCKYLFLPQLNMEGMSKLKKEKKSSLYCTTSISYSLIKKRKTSPLCHQYII